MVLMALSVESGYLMMAYLSQVDSFFTIFREYFGVLVFFRVTGLLNVTLLQILCFLLVWVPFLTEPAACLAYTD